MKKTNNKGFSLVELIIVIAIMAVLIGVLAPQFIRYVERSRVQKDRSAIAEVENAIEVALASENIYQEVSAITTATVTVPVAISRAGVISSTATVPLLIGDLQSTLGSFTLTSQTYPNGAVITITETANGTFTFAVSIP